MSDNEMVKVKCPCCKNDDRTVQKYEKWSNPNVDIFWDLDDDSVNEFLCHNCGTIFELSEEEYEVFCLKIEARYEG